MPKIQLITDGHPQHTTLIIDGVDVTAEYTVGWINLEAFSRDPLEIKRPYFKLQYGIIEDNPLDPKTTETAVKTIVVKPDDAGGMQTSLE
ncbi:MAG: hypothetical protein DRP42_02745 [Tenericutes bacterium]|nr:MAG: hypothetical protein DRP42_02745 [Mycoplasmatota bacterium]